MFSVAYNKIKKNSNKYMLAHRIGYANPLYKF